MVVSRWQHLLTTIGEISPRKALPVMAKPFREDLEVFRKEYLPRSLRQAFYLCRLANAENARWNVSKFRYMIDGINIHEAIEPDREIWFQDFLDECLVSFTELLQTLPEDLRKLVLAS